MSTSRTSVRRIVGDHFEPDENVDPKAQRQLRGHLEHIDYSAYAANRKVIAAALETVDAKTFERLGLATAQARTRWVVAGLAITENGQTPTFDQIGKLAQFRAAYEELTAVYDAMRRMVERGYVTYEGA